jgi:hypothetical protein
VAWSIVDVVNSVQKAVLAAPAKLFAPPKSRLVQFRDAFSARKFAIITLAIIFDYLGIDSAVGIFQRRNFHFAVKAFPIMGVCSSWLCSRA